MSLKEKLLAAAEKGRGRLDIGDKFLTKLSNRLDQDMQSALTDFGFQFAGGKKLKDESSLSVTNVMAHSPGGIQLGGAGDVSQQVTQQNVYASLEFEIEKMLRSPEVLTLDQTKRDELLDIGDALLHEIKQGKPEKDKVKRRGTLLTERLTEFGIAVSANTIGNLLASLVS